LRDVGGIERLAVERARHDACGRPAPGIEGAAITLRLRQPARRAPVPSTVKLTAVAAAFSRGGDTPTTVDPAGRRLDCHPRGLQADGGAGRSGRRLCDYRGSVERISASVAGAIEVGVDCACTAGGNRLPDRRCGGV
jgi:hypothetical protein